MFRTLRLIVPVMCLAVWSVSGRADDGAQAAAPGQPSELADYLASIGPQTPNGAPIQVAQAKPAPGRSGPAKAASKGGAEPKVESGAPGPNPPGPQVIEFDFQKKPTDQPDVFAQPVFNEFVTLDFKNADIQNVIRLLSARTGLNILLDPSEVKGNITLHLDNVRLGYALDNILKVNKLAYVIETGGIVRIVPESRVGRSQVETHTEVINLNWRDATIVEKTFTPFLSEHGSMKANEEAQAIVITDTPPNIAKIKELIQQIDRPDRQVVIQARLVDIQIDATRNLNSSWSLSKLNKQAGEHLLSKGEAGPTVTGADILGAILSPKKSIATLGGVAPVLIEGVGVSGGLGTYQFGTQIGMFGTDYDLNATLTALEQRNVVEILASPRVTTLNNVPATINIVEKIPYLEAVSGPSQGTTAAQVEFADAGVKITVKPIITLNGFVRLDMDLSQKIFRTRTDNGGGAAGSALAPPIIDERNSHTTVIVKDNNTVVLGGLRQIDKHDTIEGVPWLHRIPVIGWMFKNKGNIQGKSELVLMVTPDIVEEASLSDREKHLYDKIDTDWHLPDYFMDDVKTDQDRPKEK